MNVKDKDIASENYVIISYSHENTDAVLRELESYDKNNLCYWFDTSMTGGENYEKKFFDALDEKNCKGIIFFISESFLLSGPCGGEMRHFLENHKKKGTDKFCLFVMPPGFPSSNAKEIKAKVTEYLKNRPDQIEKALWNLTDNIDLLLELNDGGKMIYAVLGDEKYIKNYCGEGQVFSKSAITFGRTETTECTFGYFPQNQNRRTGASGIEAEGARRPLDGQTAYYSKVNWLVISDNKAEATLLSRDLLFSVGYLDLKYPLRPGDAGVSKTINKIFMDHFRKGNDEKWNIKNVRFLSESELERLIARAQKGPEEKRKILLPKATFFSQVPNSMNVYAFWLAGDMENARRVDLWKKRLSEMEAGVETFHVRVVIDVEKQ
ncbi:MAG: hypothetical protein LBV13_05495 [Methanomassiliicoccaceae archaeon]|jgi:hypothetical protein|nr:hypothetical protein [Methanomassiliicoccaceae archaeon]